MSFPAATYKDVFQGSSGELQFASCRRGRGRLTEGPGRPLLAVAEGPLPGSCQPSLRPDSKRSPAHITILRSPEEENLTI